jgi:hypothetical protein
MNNGPIITMQDLAAADASEIQEGYNAWARDVQPPPGASSAFMLGWRNARADVTGEVDDDQRKLAAAIAADDLAISDAREASALLRVEPRFDDAEGFSGKAAA